MEPWLAVGSAVLVNFYHSEPCMDEFFHVRQLEKYLNGDFASWDPKITTLPGLYFFSYAIFKIFPLHSYLPLIHLCRILNSLLLFPISYILKSHSPLTSNLILLYPPLFMSSVLYYTDTLSLLSILLVSLCVEREKNIQGFFLGAFAIFCRQTNVIWIGYFVGKRILVEYEIKSMKDVVKILGKIERIIWDYFGYISLLILFISFAYINKGITVGDRDNHTPGVHLAQVLYLFLVLALFCPLNIPVLKQSLFVKPWLMLVPFAFLAIFYFSYAHAFLLSDNTHYTFYLWKNVLKPYGIYLSPLYAIAFYYLNPLNTPEFFLWLICSSLVLVPAVLLELRYFIIPITVYLIDKNLEAGSLRIWALRGLNIATIAIFAVRPYKNIAFMW